MLKCQFLLLVKYLEIQAAYDLTTDARQCGGVLMEENL